MLAIITLLVPPTQPACPLPTLFCLIFIPYKFCCDSHFSCPLPHSRPSQLPSLISCSLSQLQKSISRSYTILLIHIYHLVEMAVSGFEGFEKRLELHFSGDEYDPVHQMGLRLLDFESLDEVLHEVQCTVVSAVGNRFFDAYVLSESSLFVYPKKIIIKTCGTTQLLKSIRPLIHHANNLLMGGLHLTACKYTRGSFIFPESQPFPHASFDEEVHYIEKKLPSNLLLGHKKATIMPSTKITSTSHAWHVFAAASLDHEYYDQWFPLSAAHTIEVCMTQIDQVMARKFFQHPPSLPVLLQGDHDQEEHLAVPPSGGLSAGRKMTEITGIGNLNPNALICDFAFDPCGYSMNAMDGHKYSTIHVTPEDGYSYASFECVGSLHEGSKEDVVKVLSKVARIFRPGTMSIAISYNNDDHNYCKYHDLWVLVANELRRLGLKRQSYTSDHLLLDEIVTFQIFTCHGK
ncbi:hypothetical protein Dimus_001404 [Dionaea muscipula]